MNFCVIGMGLFGSYLARELSSRGHRVVVVDRDEAQLEAVAEFVDDALKADAANEKTLQDIGIEDFDWVLITITEDLESSILIAMLAKELGARKVLVKAASELHARILEKLGVDWIVFPERDVAQRVAESLQQRGPFDFLELAPGYRIEEIKAPPTFANRTLRELDLRRRYGVSVLAIRRFVPRVQESTGEVDVEEKVVVPGPDDTIMEGDVLITLGKVEDLERLRATL